MVIPEHPALYLIIAVLCLVVAMRSLRRALEPVGVVVEVMKASIVVAFALGAALIFVLAAAISG
ncbi:hypothetical protein [Catenuloplanes niger]|uniref:Uncharacterized protein n=1 Tax=Catenuloplanes niger TaxID=587534 RepID=A0AAE3ZXV4_9ACTN|nr:hypothetical protein [Catenuloplanes niger]MDR7328069.1 hypothetical protein [Catenuloplanes niger]